MVRYVLLFALKILDLFDILRKDKTLTVVDFFFIFGALTRQLKHFKQHPVQIMIENKIFTTKKNEYTGH